METGLSDLTWIPCQAPSVQPLAFCSDHALISQGASDLQAHLKLSWKLHIQLWQFLLRNPPCLLLLSLCLKWVTCLPLTFIPPVVLTLIPHPTHTTTLSTLLCHLHIQVPSFGEVLVFETVSDSLGWPETSGPPASTSPVMEFNVRFIPHRHAQFM